MFDVRIKTGDSLAAIQHRASSIEHRVLILGIGNILLQDEGVGVHVVHELQKRSLPDNVEVIDAGTSGLDILLSQEGLYKLVVIDAIKAGNKPGTVYKTRLNTWPRCEPHAISLHQFGLLCSLTAAEKMNCAPDEIVIIGVEPGQIDLGLEPSEPVKQSIPKVIEKILEEIQDAIHGE